MFEGLAFLDYIPRCMIFPWKYDNKLYNDTTIFVGCTIYRNSHWQFLVWLNTSPFFYIHSQFSLIMSHEFPSTIPCLLLKSLLALFGGHSLPGVGTADRYWLWVLCRTVLGRGVRNVAFGIWKSKMGVWAISMVRFEWISNKVSKHQGHWRTLRHKEDASSKQCERCLEQ